MQKPFRGLLQGTLGNQADDFAGNGNDSVAGGFALHEFEDAMDGSLVEVGQVHRDLGEAADEEAGSLDEAQAAAGKAHGFGDFLRDGDIGRIQKDVVGNEKFARADYGRSGGGMDARLAEIGAARGVGGDFSADAFELAAANVLQILALGSGGGGFIQIDGNLETLGDFGSDVARHGDAVFNGHAFDRDEGYDIGCTHARMSSLMMGEVDQFGGLACAANGGFLNGLAVADESDDRAIVVGIHFAVEEIDSRNFHGGDDGVNFGRVAAFGKIRNAFNKSAAHGEKDNGRGAGQATAVRGFHTKASAFTTGSTEVHRGAFGDGECWFRKL